MKMSQTRTEPGLAFLLSQTGFHAANQFEERLTALDLKPQHAGLLRMLASKPGLTQQAMCDIFGIHPSRLVALLDELAERRLVERRRHPSDRRSYHVHITGPGIQALDRIGAIAQKLESDVFAALSVAERRQLSDMLERIVAQQGMTWAVHPAYQKRVESQRASEDQRRRGIR